MAATKTLCSFLILTTVFAMIVGEKHLLIDKLRLDFLDLEERLWKFVLWEASTVNRDEATFYLIKSFNEFDQKLKQIPEEILRGLEPIRQIRVFLFLYSELKNTEVMYEKFRKFQEDQQRINSIGYNDKRTITEAIQLEDIVRDILHLKTGANGTMHKVYEFMFEEEFSMSLQIFQVLITDFHCKDFFQSPQQILYNTYNAIALNGLKNYMMLQFAYLASRMEKKGNYTELSHTEQVNYKKRVNETMSVFRGSMEIAPTTIWRCDPKQYIKDKTYAEITRLLQGHVQNEADMNSGGTCRNDCASYPASTSFGCYDSESKYCREMERCSGKIMGCQFVESHMNICLSKSSSRRYDYIEYESGKTLGKKSQCWKKPVKSWWRWFVHCSYCMCLCDEQGPKSDRFISMRPVTADIANNRVVTGLRFVKLNRIVHLQIQEGKLLPYGYVDNTTVHWAPVDDFKITDPDIYSGTDYLTMTYENRSLALDHVVVRDPDYVVTGVRMVFKDDMLRFQIQVSPFDWNNGSVSQSLKTQMFIPSGGKYPIELHNLDVPTEAPMGTDYTPDSFNYNEDRYVSFTHTDINKDAAQTTIPFIDLQPVFNDPPVPLKGAGIHYRGKNSYGGFIAPGISTYSYSYLLIDDLHKIDVRNSASTPSFLIPNA